MAVQFSSDRGVPLYVLIIFVVLFLLSTTGLVLLYVNQEDLKTSAQTANAAFESYIGTRLKNSGRLEPYKALGSASSPKKSAVEALLEERDTLATILTGSSSATSEEIIAKIDSILAKLPDEAAGLKNEAKSNLISALLVAANTITNQEKQIANLKDQINKLQDEKATIAANYRKLEEAFSKKTDEFIAQLKTLQQLVNSYKEQYTSQLAVLKEQLSKESQEQLAKIEEQFKSQIKDIKDQIQRNINALIAATKGVYEVAKYSEHTAPDTLTSKADGRVIDKIGDIIYINLGEINKVKPGLRFVVIPQDQKDLAYPKIKAVIEIIRTGRFTSECRIVKMKDPTTPPMKGDLILNIAYDKDKTYKFFILGQIDLDNDGIVDVNGISILTDAILTAGSNVANIVTTDIDFVIMGTPISKPREPAPGAGKEATEKYEQELREYHNFIELSNQIRALGLQSIPADVFIKYLGL